MAASGKLSALLATKLVDRILFLVVVLVGSEFIVFGKPVSEAAFSERSADVLLQSRFIWPSAVSAVTAALYAWQFGSRNTLRTNFFVGCLIGFSGAVLAQAFPDYRSPLVLVLHFFFYGIVSAVILAQGIFRTSSTLIDSMEMEHAKILVDALLRTLRYILILYVAGVATLEYISGNKGESTNGYITTLFYPTIVLLIGLAMLFYWLALPFAERFLERAPADKRD